MEYDVAKIKEFRGVATRYDKTNCSHAACWNLVAALIASRWLSTEPNIFFAFFLSVSASEKVEDWERFPPPEPERFYFINGGACHTQTLALWLDKQKLMIFLTFSDRSFFFIKLQITGGSNGVYWYLVHLWGLAQVPQAEPWSLESILIIFLPKPKRMCTNLTVHYNQRFTQLIYPKLTIFN